MVGYDVILCRTSEHGRIEKQDIAIHTEGVHQKNNINVVSIKLALINFFFQPNIS